MVKWWQKEKKGMPIAVATPVHPGAVHVGPIHSPPASTGSPTEQQLTTNYVAAPSYSNSPQRQQNLPINELPIIRFPQGVDGQILEALGERTLPHKLLLLFNILAGFVGCNNLVAQAVALMYFKDDLQMELTLRMYLLGFCALVIANETERFPTLRDQSYVLSNWVCRGIFYSFLGVLGQNLYDVGYDNRYRRNRYNYNSNGTSGGGWGWFTGQGSGQGYYGPRFPTKEDFAEWYIWMTSFLMFLVGIIYIIMGSICLQKRLNAMREQYQQSRLQAECRI